MSPTHSRTRTRVAWCIATSSPTTCSSRGSTPSWPMLAAEHDTIGLQNAIRFIDSKQRPLPPNMPAIAVDILGYLTATNQAYLALARGDSAEALRLFDARPDSACFGGCWIDDLIHVQLLAARGRPADAAARLERPRGGFAAGVVPLEVLTALER